jgi:hypothetical protein
VVVELLEQPALDAPAPVTVLDGQRTQDSLRAALLAELTKVEAEHRSSFMPLLQKMLQSDKNGESNAAQRVLEVWK